MQKKRKFRNEHKYFCNEKDLAIIQNRLENICILDPHTKNGRYHIRSLYFDTWDLQYYYENENGTDPREKWRIRMYDCNAELLMLECKRKEKGMTQKRSCQILKKEVEEIILGDWNPDMAEMSDLKMEFYLKMQMKGLRPSVIVDYERVPYIYDIGNVRITFDKYLSGSKEIAQFFDENLALTPIPLEGCQILEVKFDELLPDYIKSCLQLKHLIKTACSKYYLCKKSF